MFWYNKIQSCNSLLEKEDTIICISHSRNLRQHWSKDFTKWQNLYTGVRLRFKHLIRLPFIHLHWTRESVLLHTDTRTYSTGILKSTRETGKAFLARPLQLLWPGFHEEDSNRSPRESNFSLLRSGTPFFNFLVKTNWYLFSVSPAVPDLHSFWNKISRKENHDTAWTILTLFSFFFHYCFCSRNSITLYFLNLAQSPFHKISIIRPLRNETRLPLTDHSWYGRECCVCDGRQTPRDSIGWLVSTVCVAAPIAASDLGLNHIAVLGAPMGRQKLAG